MSTGSRLALLALTAVLAFPANAGLPDWAEATAESAPPIPEGVPEWPERTLLSDTKVVVEDGGSAWRIRRRSVIQVLSNRVDEFAFGSFTFNDTSKVRKAKGWHVPPGERAQRNFGGAFDLNISDDFLTDAKARIVALHGVRKGSIVVYEFEAESHPYTQTDATSFYDDAPVSLARYTIELPAGWSLKYAWLPQAGPEPTRAGSVWRFERRDLTPIHAENLGDVPSHLGPRLVVALQPPGGASTASPAFSDWSDVGIWYQSLTKGREKPSPEIVSAVRDVLAKSGTLPLERIRAVCMFVRDRVRYLSRQVGIGGYQPHHASEVFSDLYGDCKDKGTLLRAALEVAGFASYPILIHTSNPHTISPDVPALESFDHFVVGVIWPRDVPVPAEVASSIVHVGPDTTLLVLDPTNQRAWPGVLPDNLAGKTGLAVIDGRGVLVALPVAQPSWHRIARNAIVTIAANRSVAMTRISRFYGGPAEDARSANAKSYKERRELVEQDIRAAWSGAEVTEYTVTPEDDDGAFVETVAVALPPDASALQDDTYWLFAAATQDIERVPLGKRKVSVQYSYPMELRYETTVAGAPVEATLPTAHKLLGSGWTVESSFDRSSDTVHGVWTATLERTRFESGAFPELKQFWSAAGKAAGSGLRIAP